MYTTHGPGIKTECGGSGMSSSIKINLFAATLNFNWALLHFLNLQPGVSQSEETKPEYGFPTLSDSGTTASGSYSRLG